VREAVTKRGDLPFDKGEICYFRLYCPSHDDFLCERKWNTTEEVTFYRELHVCYRFAFISTNTKLSSWKRKKHECERSVVNLLCSWNLPLVSEVYWRIELNAWFFYFHFTIAMRLSHFEITVFWWVLYSAFAIFILNEWNISRVNQQN